MGIEREVGKLARAYGEPGRATFEFADLSDGFSGWVMQLTRRRGEIVLVVPRSENRVLLHTKLHYPENVYRLPTGGILHAEAADEAARREALEEIGFHPESLQLLGVLENVFWMRDKRLDYPSFVFRTEALTAAPHPTDPDEPISGFMDADSKELEATALYLSSLPGQWREWGMFRAAAHRWLAARLQD